MQQQLLQPQAPSDSALATELGGGQGEGFPSSAFSDPLAGEHSEDPTASSANTAAPEPNLLLSLMAQLLWGNPQAVSDAARSAQALNQNAQVSGLRTAPVAENMLVAAAPPASALAGEGSGLMANDEAADASVEALSQNALNGGSGSTATPLAGAEGALPQIAAEREAALRRFAALATPATPENSEAGAHLTAEPVEHQGLSLSFPTMANPATADKNTLDGEPEKANNPPPPSEITAYDTRLLHAAPQAERAARNEQLMVDAPAKEAGRETAQSLTQALTGADQFGARLASHFSNIQTATPTSASQSAGLERFETWQAVVNQVSDGILANVQQHSSEARLQLEPPELGRLDIQLVVEGERIHAHIVAESAEVRTLIQTHLPELKHALQSHRLDLDTVRVEVQSGGGDPDMSSQHFQQEARESNRRRNVASAQPLEPEEETPLPATSIGRRGRISVWA